MKNRAAFAFYVQAHSAYYQLLNTGNIFYWDAVSPWPWMNELTYIQYAFDGFTEVPAAEMQGTVYYEMCTATTSIGTVACYGFLLIQDSTFTENMANWGRFASNVPQASCLYVTGGMNELKITSTTFQNHHFQEGHSEWSLMPYNAALLPVNSFNSSTWPVIFFEGSFALSSQNGLASFVEIASCTFRNNTNMLVVGVPVMEANQKGSLFYGNFLQSVTLAFESQFKMTGCTVEDNVFYGGEGLFYLSEFVKLNVETGNVFQFNGYYSTSTLTAPTVDQGALPVISGLSLFVSTFRFTTFEPGQKAGVFSITNTVAVPGVTWAFTANTFRGNFATTGACIKIAKNPGYPVSIKGNFFYYNWASNDEGGVLSYHATPSAVMYVSSLGNYYYGSIVPIYMITTRFVALASVKDRFFNNYVEGGSISLTSGAGIYVNGTVFESNMTTPTTAQLLAEFQATYVSCGGCTRTMTNYMDSADDSKFQARVNKIGGAIFLQKCSPITDMTMEL